MAATTQKPDLAALVEQAEEVIKGLAEILPRVEEAADRLEKRLREQAAVSRKAARAPKGGAS